METTPKKMVVASTQTAPVDVCHQGTQVDPAMIARSEAHTWTDAINVHCVAITYGVAAQFVPKEVPADGTEPGGYHFQTPAQWGMTSKRLQTSRTAPDPRFSPRTIKATPAEKRASKPVITSVIHLPAMTRAALKALHKGPANLSATPAALVKPTVPLPSASATPSAVKPTVPVQLLARDPRERTWTALKQAAAQTSATTAAKRACEISEMPCIRRPTRPVPLHRIPSYTPHHVEEYIPQPGPDRDTWEREARRVLAERRTEKAPPSPAFSSDDSELEEGEIA